GRRKPQELGQVPLALREVFVVPAPARLHDADPVALLRSSERGDTSTEPRADDHDVVLEGAHAIFLLIRYWSGSRFRPPLAPGVLPGATRVGWVQWVPLARRPRRAVTVAGAHVTLEGGTMSTIHLTQSTTLTPEQYVAGLTDFGPGRNKVFSNSADDDLVVHSVQG